MAEETVFKVGFAENSMHLSESDKLNLVNLISDDCIPAKQFFEVSGESDGSNFSSCLSPPSLIPIIEHEDNSQKERTIFQGDSLFDYSIPLPSLSCEVTGRLKSNRKRNLPSRFGDYCSSASLSKQLKSSSSKKKKKSVVGPVKKSSLNCKLKYNRKLRENEESSRTGSLCQNVDEVDGLSFCSFATIDELDDFCAGQSFNTNPSNTVVEDNSNICTRLNAIKATADSVLCQSQSCFSQSTQERYSRFLASIVEFEAKLSSCLPLEYSFQAGITAVIDAMKLFDCI